MMWSSSSGKPLAIIRQNTHAAGPAPSLLASAPVPELAPLARKSARQPAQRWSRPVITARSFCPPDGGPMTTLGHTDRAAEGAGREPAVGSVPSSKATSAARRATRSATGTPRSGRSLPRVLTPTVPAATSSSPTTST